MGKIKLRPDSHKCDEFEENAYIMVVDTKSGKTEENIPDLVSMKDECNDSSDDGENLDDNLLPKIQEKTIWQNWEMG